GRLQHHEARGVDLGRTVRQQLLYLLLRAGRPGELAARTGVRRQRLSQARRLADSARSERRESEAAERIDGMVESDARLPERALRAPTARASARADTRWQAAAPQRRCRTRGG